MLPPLPFRLLPRYHVTTRLRVLVTLCAVLLALVVGAVFLASAGVNPLLAYAAMGRAAFFGGAFALSDTAVKATPLILCGLGCAIAFRMRLWNVGAEGQLLLGAWAATGVASIWLPDGTPTFVLLPLMALAAAVTGGLYGALAGWLKVRFGVSEILSTLMLVYVASHWNNYWVFSAWSQGGFPLTPLFPEAARLPRLLDYAETYPSWSGLTLHLGFLVALVAAGLVHLWQKRSQLGFEIEVLGDNPSTAAASGIRVARTTIVVLLLSGALAGLAGMVEVSGVVFRLQERFSPGYGFTAIIVAWLARLHPLAIIVVGLVLGGLLVGSREVQPSGIALMLQGLVLFVVVGSEFFIRYRLVRARVEESQVTLADQGE